MSSVIVIDRVVKICYIFVNSLIFMFDLIIFIVMDSIISLVIGFFAFLIAVDLIGVDNVWRVLITLIVSLGCGGIVYCILRNFEKADEMRYQHGETITSLVKRSDRQGNCVYILTEDERTLTSYEDEYKLVTPGDTVVYQLSTTGKTRIISVKFSDEVYVPRHEEKQEKENDQGLQFMANPSYTVSGSGSPVLYF